MSVCLSGPDHDSGLLPRSLSVIFNSIEDRLYGLSDLKPQRCRDFSKLTLDQQAAEISSKKNLLRLLKEVRHVHRKCIIIIRTTGIKTWELKLVPDLSPSY